jgi:hypothetical protein
MPCRLKKVQPIAGLGKKYCGAEAKTRIRLTARPVLGHIGAPAPHHNRMDADMLFMIIERFKDNDMVPVYQRVRDSGRSLPEGLRYVDSWIEPNFARCFQLMETDDARLLQEWVLSWRGLGVTFEIAPVVPSAETRAVVAPFLDGEG